MYLGIDLGTSGVKTLLMDGVQNPIASASAPLEVSRPHKGWSEQNPAHWIDAVTKTFDQLHKTHLKELAAVVGIGLSGQLCLGAESLSLARASR